MEYELKKVEPIGNPYTDKRTSKYGINIVITVGVVGNTYIGFCNKDGMFFELDKSDSIDVSQVKMNVFAVDYVANKYPNT